MWVDLGILRFHTILAEDAVFWPLDWAGMAKMTHHIAGGWCRLSWEFCWSCGPEYLYLAFWGKDSSQHSSHTLKKKSLLFIHRLFFFLMWTGKQWCGLETQTPYFFLIDVWLIYNVVLVSGVLKSDAVRHVYISKYILSIKIIISVKDFVRWPDIK